MTAKVQFSLILIAALFFSACSDNNNNKKELEVPALYEFNRDGTSTVSFSGQTTRILMAEELNSEMKEYGSIDKTLLLKMFRHRATGGSEANPFSDPALNAANDKQIKSKVAASYDFKNVFASTTQSEQIKDLFEEWIEAQVDEIDANSDQTASAGVAGQVVDGDGARYVNGEGLEFNQLVAKGLIGALMTDQALNNYLSTNVLDEGQNRDNQQNGVTEDEKSYTTMEHKWDEAYGYLYGTAQNPANPNPTIGEDDSFLNKYIARVENDSDFEGTAETIFEAFKTGRAAIVAGDFETRDEQANIIRAEISKVIAVRAVYYLQSGKRYLHGSNQNTGGGFHALSEGYGFIYSLQFTRVPNSDSPYFTPAEVTTILDKLMGDGENGLWDVTPETLDQLSDQIADAFEFTVQEAAE
jgi:hypothetical protein